MFWSVWPLFSILDLCTLYLSVTSITSMYNNNYKNFTQRQRQQHFQHDSLWCWFPVIAPLCPHVHFSSKSIWYFAAVVSRSCSPSQIHSKDDPVISHVCSQASPSLHSPLSPQPPFLCPPCPLFSFISSLRQFSLSCVSTLFPTVGAFGLLFVQRNLLNILFNFSGHTDLNVLFLFWWSHYIIWPFWAKCPSPDTCTIWWCTHHTHSPACASELVFLF